MRSHAPVLPNLASNAPMGAVGSGAFGVDLGVAAGAVNAARAVRERYRIAGTSWLTLVAVLKLAPCCDLDSLTGRECEG